MYCKKCGKDQDNDVCFSCQEKILSDKKTAHKASWGWGKWLAVIIVIVVLALIRITGSLADKNNSDTANDIFNDVVYGTSQSKDTNIVNATSDLFKSYKEEWSKRFPFTITLDNSNVLEFESFETKIAIKDSIDILNGSIAELGNLDNLFAELRQSATKKINSLNTLSEDDKKDILEAFYESLDNEDRIYYTKRRYETLKAFYEEILNLYKFLLLNFDDYYIDFDENNEENIFFYSDSNISKYNNFMIGIESKRRRFLEAENALYEYSDQKLKDQGVDINLKDLQNSI